MNKILLSIVASLSLLGSTAQEQSCFERLEKAFNERGSYTVSDDIHRNVIISFFENGEVTCIKGKARVKNGTISSIFIYFDDNTSELYDSKFYNQKNQPPIITNGISEMATTSDGEKFRVAFIDFIKPKKKSIEEAVSGSYSENKNISDHYTQFHKHGPNCMKSYSGKMTVNDIKASSVSSATTDAIYREYEVMKLFFNVNPIFIFSDEIPGPAFFPDLNFINKPLSFIYDYERKNYGKEIINAVLAHEFAHALQYKSGMYEYWRDGKKPELHADFLAGFYMGKKELLSKDKLTAFANEFYGIGDFDFFAPQHHGTPEERRCAFLEGYMVSKDYDFNIYQAYNAGIDYIRLLSACDAFAIIQDYSKTEIKNDYISPVGNYVFSSTQKEIYFCNVYGQPIGKASPDNKLYFNSLPVGVYTIIPAIRKPNGMLKYYSPYTFEVKQNNTGKFEINDVGTFAIRTYSISF
jgi:hypothetical protein